MYLAAVLLLLVILPLASVAAQFFLSRHAVDAVFLVGRWFAFWAVGIRLFTAGVRQVIQPRFTAEEIFGAYENGSLALVREIGFANLSMGTLGICQPVSRGLDRARRHSGRPVLWLGRLPSYRPEDQEREGVHGHDLRRLCISGAVAIRNQTDLDAPKYRAAAGRNNTPAITAQKTT